MEKKVKSILAEFNQTDYGRINWRLLAGDGFVYSSNQGFHSFVSYSIEAEIRHSVAVPSTAPMQPFQVDMAPPAYFHKA
jgi:hypothetical protein